MLPSFREEEEAVKKRSWSLFTAPLRDLIKKASGGAAARAFETKTSDAPDYTITSIQNQLLRHIHDKE